MVNPPDDSYKDLFNIIQNILGNHLKGKNGMPPIVGIKLVVDNPNNNGDDGKNGGFCGFADPNDPRAPRANVRMTPVEVFESDVSYTIQTELPGECPDNFEIRFEDGKLRLLTGEHKEYSAVLPLKNVNQASIQTRLKNSVLEIYCEKMQDVSKVDTAEEIKAETAGEVKVDTAKEVKTDTAEEVKADTTEGVKADTAEEIKADTTEERGADTSKILEP